MKKIYITVIISLSLLMTVGCEDFLDRKINTNFDEDMFLNSGFENLKSWGLGTYVYLRHYNALEGGASLAAACDEADFSKQTAVQKFNTGAWNQFSNPDDVFAHYYKGIRHANLFLEKTVDFKDLIYEDTIIATHKESYIRKVHDFTKLRAEVRLLRAYFYFELIKRYGGVPLVTQSLTLNDDLKKPRDSFDDCIEFIVTECDEAYEDLVNYWANYNEDIGVGGAGSNNANLGRLEKPVAKALKIRALLYSASELHNPSNDMQKWKAVVAAAADFFSDPDCSHVQYLNQSYKNLFQAEASNDAIFPYAGKNTGLIMTRAFANSGFAFEQANYPIGMANTSGNVICPSQNLVDAFEYIDGTPFDPHALSVSDNPYEGRDPRLEMIVVVNNSIMGKNIDGTDRTVESYRGGSDGIGIKYGATTTGYYLRKALVENFDLTKNPSKPKAWVLMRYAEVLLNYAEAMNEVAGPTVTSVDGITLPFSARDAVNQIRARVNMAPLSTSLDKGQMKEAIRHERRIELAFEDHRFFDVRRWKIAGKTEVQPLRGILVTKINDDTFTYEEFKVEDRIFEEKMYLYPIPYSEISKSEGAIVQNPGW